MNNGYSISRRGFLGLSAGFVLAACSGSDDDDNAGRDRAASTTTTSSLPVPALESDPFTLGVASGDPAADGFVLWTRLALDPLAGGGMPAVDVPVRYMVATDDAMRDVVTDAVFVTGAAVGHTVHAVVEGLDENRPYWYRFAVGDWETPVARTRTFPAPGTTPDRLRFGFASCQNYRDGYYTAWADVAADEDLDLVVFLGDYIYESGLEGNVRAHQIAEVVTLDDYRNQYALYRSDPLLRGAHAIAPWLVTWDDHEVENNYQGATPELASATPDSQQFLARRAAGYRAWWEHMPTRLDAPTGPDFPIHQRVDFGDLARFHVLDTRQYRTDQPCEADPAPRCAEANDTALTVLGLAQEAWLEEGLSDSDATWNVLAQQIVFSRLAFGEGDGAIYNLDQWDGYPAAQQRVLAMLDGVSNPVVITGDIHSSGVSDVKADFDDPASAVIGTEFVGTSISSNAPAALAAVVPIALASNPHAKWADATKRGWVRCDVTPAQWQADYRLVDDALVEGAPVTTARSWVVEAGGSVQEA